MRPIVHIVRRYGPVGGMEKYVWRLTQELSAMGLPIEIICEEDHQQEKSAILVHKVPQSKAKPRWQSMFSFRDHVDSFLAKQFGSSSVIHSHERSLRHHVTTFHGPPMLPKERWWNIPYLNRRVRGWQELERDELLSPQVQYILPVSSKIQEQLANMHPEIAQKQIKIAWPGVDQLSNDEKYIPLAPRENLALLFVGREWKRKGLDIALQIVDALAKSIEVSLTVYGPTLAELPRPIRNSPFLDIRPWTQQIPWHQFDGLIHPARQEPFGMVIPEARQHGLFVVTSDQVGSTELDFQQLGIVPVHAPVDAWVAEIKKQSNQSVQRILETKWTWGQLARLHIEEIYPNIST